jgi:hypothetical protein
MEDKYYCIIWIKNKRHYIKNAWYFGAHSLRAEERQITTNIKEAQAITKGEKLTLSKSLQSLQASNKIDRYVYIGVKQYKKYIEYFA